MKVTMNSGSIHEVIEISTPSENDVLDLDFNGHYLIQCKFDGKDLIPTGKGVDGRGTPLNEIFYENLSLTYSKKK